MFDEIKLEVGGKLFSGWKNLAIDEAMEQLSGKFKTRLFDKQGDAARVIKAGLPCRWYLVNGDNNHSSDLIEGYIDKTRKKISGTATDMTFSGRDKTGDLVDCAAVHKSNTWTNAKLASICSDLVEPFGLVVDTSDLQDTDIIERFTLQNGESVFEAVERLCMSQNVLPLHTINGNLKLTYTAPESSRAIENLELGVNLLGVEEEDAQNERFSLYVVKGQQSNKGKAWSGENTRLFASAEDVNIVRYRPRLFMSENRATAKNLIRRVNWEAQVRAGRGLKYTATVKGWFQKDSKGQKIKPWTINERTNLKVSRWDVDRELLITGLSRTLDEASSRVTRLTMKHPDTYSANPTAKVKLN